jgi:hypothetical protein
MAGRTPAFFQVTEDDHGPFAVVVAFSSISIITLVTVIRFRLAAHQKVKFDLDDLTFAIATVSSTGKPP